MEDKIKELRNEGKTVREVSKILNIGRDKAHKLIKKLESNISIKPDMESDRIGQDIDISINDEDLNSIGVKKLRKSDYTKEALEKFPTAPYWD